jgi:hypothetical protein
MRRFGQVLLIGMLLAGGFPGSRAQTEESLPAENLMIPASLGKIEERFTGQGNRWILHIQDVHALLAAQENIAAILDHLNAVYGIRTVAVEGGWSASSWPKTWGLPSSQEKQNLAQTLLEEDYIGGPAYAAMFSKTPMTLLGLENRDLYEKNREIYLSYLERREDTLAKVKAEESKLAQAKKDSFNANLLNFDFAVGQFREGKNPEKVIPGILNAAGEKGIGLSDLGQLELYKQISALSKSVQKNKLDSEIKRLSADYKYERLSFEELLAGGKIPEEKLSHYPEALKLRELLSLQKNLSHRKFFAELEEAIRRIKAALYASDTEKNADALYDRFQTAKQIIALKATPSDLKNYASFAAEIAAEIDSAGLKEALDLALDFYRTVGERDEAFFKKITEDPRFTGNLALVTGGFHTEGLAERFEKAGISYMVITPEIGKGLPKEDLYAKRMSENRAAPATGQSLSAQDDRKTDEPAAKISIKKRRSPDKITAHSRQTLSEKQDRDTDPALDERFAPALEEVKKRMIGLTEAAGRVAAGTADGRRKSSPASAPAKKPSSLPKRPVKGDFSRAPLEKQKELAGQFWDWQTGTAPIAVVIKASVMADLITPKSENDADKRSAKIALANLRIYLKNRANLLFLLNDDPRAYQTVAEEIIGKKNVKITRGNDLAAAVAKQKIKNPKTAVIALDYTPTEGILVLPPSASSLFLARPLLEHEEFGNFFANPEAVSAFERILADILTTQNILEAA